MTNEIDKIFPKPADALKGISDSIDKINGMAMAAENKDEIIPSLTCQICYKDLNPEKDKFYDSPEGQFCDNCMIKNEAQQQNLKRIVIWNIKNQNET